MKVIEMQYSFVAFIDILGFSMMVNHDCEHHVSQQKYLSELHQIHEKTKELKKSFSGIDVKQFSDSVILSIPFSKDLETLNRFIDVVSNYQFDLLLSGILCRGGVSFGKHYFNDDFIFSGGLIDAYKLESTIAKNPRIVISPELISLFGKGRLQGVSVERDGYHFINYLKKGTVDIVWQKIEKIINSPGKKDHSVREKHLWLIDFFNINFPDEVKIKTDRFSFW